MNAKFQKGIAQLETRMQPYANSNMQPYAENTATFTQQSVEGNQQTQTRDQANEQVIPTNQNQSGSNQFGSNQNQSGLELSEYGMNKPDIEPIPLNIEEIIQDKFLEVVGNQLVTAYFDQKTKLNQSFGMSGFNGVFKLVEEIPNFLLEHHPLAVYWKKRVGQFENAVVNATEAFFKQDNTVQQMSQHEQMALNALVKRVNVVVVNHPCVYSNQ